MRQTRALDRTFSMFESADSDEGIARAAAVLGRSLRGLSDSERHLAASGDNPADSSLILRDAFRLERLAAELAWFSRWLELARSNARAAGKEFIAPPAIAKPAEWKVFCRHMLSVVATFSVGPQKLFLDGNTLSSGELLALAVIAGVPVAEDVSECREAQTILRDSDGCGLRLKVALVASLKSIDDGFAGVTALSEEDQTRLEAQDDLRGRIRKRWDDHRAAVVEDLLLLAFNPYTHQPLNRPDSG